MIRKIITFYSFYFIILQEYLMLKNCKENVHVSLRIVNNYQKSCKIYLHVANSKNNHFFKMTDLIDSNNNITSE